MCHPSHAQRSCGCAPSGASRAHRYAHHHYPGEQFGVRRPLRFLAWKLGLEEAQVVELATILNDLKTERAQSEVDDRRALALLADAAQGETFDRDKAAEATRLRTQSAERVQQKVLDSLGRMHAVLNAEQRGRLAYLLRTGALVM
jgi:Spy/CpxP family protein refolding chaperone